jgi:hypothetical protein
VEGLSSRVGRLLPYGTLPPFRVGEHVGARLRWLRWLGWTLRETIDAPLEPRELFAKLSVFVASLSKRNAKIPALELGDRLSSCVVDLLLGGWSGFVTLLVLRFLLLTGRVLYRGVAVIVLRFLVEGLCGNLAFGVIHEFRE